jgi:subtilase family serine protease
VQVVLDSGFLFFFVMQGTSLDTLSAFNTEAMKLTAMGVTVTVSSGDNGAAEDAAFCNLISSSAPYNLWTVSPHSLTPSLLFLI